MFQSFPRNSPSAVQRNLTLVNFVLGIMDLSPPNIQELSGLSASDRRASVARGPLAGGKQITRNRASYSCHACRRRKVKCDKVCPSYWIDIGMIEQNP